MNLEDQYRVISRAFPGEWRQRHGDELVCTLLDGSSPGQRVAAAGDILDVIRRGLQLRLRNGGPLVLIVLATVALIATTVAINLRVTPTSFTFLTTSLVVVLAPGTGVVYTVSTAIADGWRRGSIAALGCTIGILPHLLAAVLGLSGLMQASARAYEVVRWAGVAYLAYLGVGMLRSGGQIAESAKTERKRSAWSAVRRGVLLNVLNPKLTMFFFAFLPQFVDSPLQTFDGRVFGLSGVFMMMTLAVFLSYAAFAARVRDRVLSTPRLLRRIERSLGLVLLGFAAQLGAAER